MSRNKELRKQNEKYSVSIMDVVDVFGFDSKYNELLLKLIKERISTSFVGEIGDYCRELNISYGLIMSKLPFQQLLILKIIDRLGKANMDSFRDFIKEFDENRIIVKDLSKYESFDDIQKQLSIVELRNITKELENEVIKIYEDDEYILIKPLSWEASKKYGSNTKWCTASKYDYSQFERYSSRGILVYILNKKTGNKQAMFKTVIDEYEKELSFWDQADRRVDSIELNLPDKILNIIKNEIVTCVNSNYSLMSDEIKLKNELTRSITEIKDDYPTPVGGPAITIQEHLILPTGVIIDEPVEISYDYQPNLTVVR